MLHVTALILDGISDAYLGMWYVNVMSFVLLPQSMAQGVQETTAITSASAAFTTPMSFALASLSTTISSVLATPMLQFSTWACLRWQQIQFNTVLYGFAGDGNDFDVDKGIGNSGSITAMAPLTYTVNVTEIVQFLVWCPEGWSDDSSCNAGTHFNHADIGAFALEGGTSMLVVTVCFNVCASTCSIVWRSS